MALAAVHLFIRRFSKYVFSYEMSENSTVVRYKSLRLTSKRGPKLFSFNLQLDKLTVKGKNVSLLIKASLKVRLYIPEVTLGERIIINLFSH